MSPTSRVDVNVGMALIVFFSTHIWGVKEKGVLGYLSHFLPPKIDVDPKSGLAIKVMMKSIYIILCFLMPVLHLVGELVKPVSLTMRLFGNMMGKEKILGVSIMLVFAFWGDGFLAKMFAMAPAMLRILITVLGVFVSFIQAFVFMLLAMVYIGGAVQSHEEHAEEH
jgi:F-type H+-transporting ATPase subunit a